MDAEPDRRASPKHAAMLDEDSPRVFDKNIGARHWIEPSDGIYRFRGIYPLSRNADCVEEAFQILLDHLRLSSGDLV